MFSPIIVADEDIENFEMIQKKYVTPMAQDAVRNRSIKQWALIKKVPGIGLNIKTSCALITKIDKENKDTKSTFFILIDL